MPKKRPELLQKKIDSLVNMIFVRSGISSEFGKQYSKFDTDCDFKINSDGTFLVYELVIYVELKSVDCPECDFEIDSFMDTIKSWKSRIEESSNIGLNSDLTPTNSFNSLRGVLLGDVSFKYSELESLGFSIHLDPQS
jgi:hypothetical protein